MKILIIDDEKLIRWSFEKHFGAEGYEVYVAETGEKGIELYEKHFPDVVFVDNKLPKMQGIEVIQKIQSIDEDGFIVFMTAYGSIDTAVEAMKKGASEYINKPFSNKEIEVILENIKNKIKENKEIKLLRKQQNGKITFDQIVGNSASIKKMIQLAKKISRTEATTILLRGESGTGKDIFARAIHNESTRQEYPFVTINCSSLPESLLESELFGYEKGAFTDAKQRKKGLFEIAEKGTVFLDEIGEISMAMQVKLLNVLENRQVRRLGGTIDQPVDIRIIAATNQDLEQAIANKNFRSDLYYRLKVFQIDLPSLQERKEDILLFAEYFIEQFNVMFHKKIRNLSEATKKVLKNYSWPGNVRELRNVIERAVILETDDIIHIESLPYEIFSLSEEIVNKSRKRILDEDESEEMKFPYFFTLPEDGISLETLERQVICQALKRTNNNQTKAADLLGISRDKLRYKKKKHNL